MLDEYTSRNNQALISLVNDHNVELRKLPNDVLAEFKRITEELLVEMTQEDESSKKIYESLCSQEEMSKARDLGSYYQIPADFRDLNYTQHMQSDLSLSDVKEYNSHNTKSV